MSWEAVAVFLGRPGPSQNPVALCRRRVPYRCGVYKDKMNLKGQKGLQELGASFGMQIPDNFPTKHP